MNKITLVLTEDDLNYNGEDMLNDCVSFFDIARNLSLDDFDISKPYIDASDKIIFRFKKIEIILKD